MLFGHCDIAAPAAAAAALLVAALWPQQDPGPAALGGMGQIAQEQEQAGEPASWGDSTTGSDRIIAPLGVFRDSNGGWCRGFEMSLNIDGRRATTHHVACRQPSGDWAVMDQAGSKGEIQVAQKR
ncbi:MAG: hypothetical protein K2Q10_10300 [Rhodospirillales bacterium]|nr:hypothetical protein [Rhodospirillales bacterium]